MDREPTSPVDGLTSATATIDYAHHEIHEGSSFVAYKFATLASAATISISFFTPNTSKETHLIVYSRSSGEANYVIKEGVAITVSTGADFTPINRNRNSSTTSTLSGYASGVAVANKVTIGATVAGGSTIFAEHHGAGNNRSGESRNTSEFVLKSNTQYEVLLTSEAAANDCELILNWYEHTDRRPS